MAIAIDTSSLKEIYIYANNVDCLIESTSVSEPHAFMKDEENITTIDLNQDGTALHIKIERSHRKTKKSFLNFSYQTRAEVEAIIELPKSLFEKLVVKNSEGAVTMRNLSIKSIHVQNEIGRIVSDNLQGEEIELFTNDGRIELKKNKFNNVGANTKDGRIILENCQAETLKVYTQDGRIEATNTLGELEATTKHGRIEYVVDEIKSPICLTTNKGRIILATTQKINNAKINTISNSSKSHIYGENLTSDIGEGPIDVKLQTNDGRIEIILKEELQY